MKILITGGTGLLGRALIETSDRLYGITATYLDKCPPKDTPAVKYRKLDIRDREGYDRLFREFRPSVVIHTAGVGSPDYAEKHKRESREINVGGTANIVSNCERYGAKFIYISSNGIYDGKNAPYREDDKARPINFYGRIKLEGEKVAKKAGVPHAIVRPILMYGWNNPSSRPNIVTFALSRLRNGENVYVYDDVYVNPLFAHSCAEAIWKIVKDERYDTFNIAGKERTSICGLIRKAAGVFGFDPALVMPVQQGFFNEMAKRPTDTSYHTEKMHAVLGIKPLSVTEGLKLMKKFKKASRDG